MIFIKVMLVKIESVLICLWWEGKSVVIFIYIIIIKEN